MQWLIKYQKTWGYSNYSTVNKETINIIDIEEEKAKEIVAKYFRELNIDLQKINKIYLSYVENDNNELVLSYVFNIVGSENDTMKDNIYSIFVRADTGEIINLNSEIKN